MTRQDVTARAAAWLRYRRLRNLARDTPPGLPSGLCRAVLARREAAQAELERQFPSFPVMFEREQDI